MKLGLGENLLIKNSQSEIPENTISIVRDGIELYIPQNGLVDLEEEAKRKEEEIKKLKFEIQRAEKMLSNPGFVIKAPRNHIEAISRVTKLALKEANVEFKDIDAITPTYGPGLVGALLVGVSYAKALSYAINKPLVGVNHIQGHIAANYLTYPELEPPFLCLLVSGGNTQIVYVKNYTEFEVLGKTRDDAIGEAFDKVARVVGLNYPGGPKVDKLAKEGEPNIKLPKTHFENSLDFSFSGIKTAVININHNTKDINIR